jgi:hypothetical protein
VSARDILRRLPNNSCRLKHDGQYDQETQTRAGPNADTFDQRSLLALLWWFRTAQLRLRWQQALLAPERYRATIADCYEPESHALVRGFRASHRHSMPEATPFAGRVGTNLNHHPGRDGRVLEVGAAGQAADDPRGATCAGQRS